MLPAVENIAVRKQSEGVIGETKDRWQSLQPSLEVGIGKIFQEQYKYGQSSSKIWGYRLAQSAERRWSGAEAFKVGKNPAPNAKNESLIWSSNAHMQILAPPNANLRKDAWKSHCNHERG